MVDAKHRIQVVLETIIKGQEKLKGLTNQQRDIVKNLKNVNKIEDDRLKRSNQWTKQSVSANKLISKGLTRQNEVTKTSDKLQGGFFRTMGLGMDNYKQAQMAYDKMTKSQKKGHKVGTRAALGIRNATHGLRGFRMEALGVMFFGMSMMRVLGGLLKTSLKWTGVMEIMSAALGILFLPAALRLLDWALSFLNFVSNLSESQKKWIGIIVLVGIALGGLIMGFGTLSLGIGSLILYWGVLAPLLSAGAAIILGIVIVISGLILVIYGIIDIVKNWGKDWKKVIMGMIKTIAGLALVIIGIGVIIGSIPILWALAVAAIVAGVLWVASKIIEHWDKIVSFCKGVAEKIVGFFLWLKDVLVGHSIIPDIVNSIIEWFGKIPGKIWEFLKGIPGKILNGYKNIGNKIADAFKGVGKKIANKFKEMIPDWMVKVFKGGTSIAGKVGSIFGFAKGGVVPGPMGAPVPALVHGGETIIPAGKSMGGTSIVSPNITIHANISSDYDVRRMADELKTYWVSDFERVSQGRGI